MTRSPTPAPRFHEQLLPFIERSPLTQREIARGIGYDRANVISMMKYGTMKVPFRKIALLARVLDADPLEMMRWALQEYSPETLAAFEDVFAGLPTSKERRLLEIIREERVDLGEPLIDCEFEERFRQSLCELSCIECGMPVT